MKMFEDQEPLIVIGMHRSGTSMIARVLHRCGVFMGANRNSHDEAYFFLRRNQWLLRTAHSYWDNPNSLHYLLEFKSARAEIIKIIKKDISSLKAMQYFGSVQYLKLKFFNQYAFKWGWKDPLNSYTLPIWLEIFPNAKVIHVVRNGADVAHSLYNREKGRRNKLFNKNTSFRCFDLNEAFLLWAEYTTNCKNIAEGLPAEQIMQIRYEDFLNEPSKNLKRISMFLNIDFLQAMESETIQSLKPEYAYRYKHDADIRSLYERYRYHPIMTHYRYDYAN